MIKYSALLVLVLTFFGEHLHAQTKIDSTQLSKEFSSIDEALEEPEKVYRLNLSDQEVIISDSIWAKFINLEYLSFKNDHMKQIPSGVGAIKSLKVLDLSGNDFKVLPTSFKNLVNLEELYLNNDKYLNLERSIPVLSELPSLKALHLEYDGLKALPKNISRLTHIESLYLNYNNFKQIPPVLQGLENLKYIDFHNNKYRMPTEYLKKENAGIKIKF
jgi:Leucine-rich repeat (LRR) protein